MGVPLLDVSRLHRSPEERTLYIQDLIASFKKYGFVRLTNHGIPAQSVNQMFGLARKLFQLSDEDKRRISNIPDGSPQRGYSAAGVEKTAALHGKLLDSQVDESLTDAREHFDCGSPLDTEFFNRWPETLEGFQVEVELFYFELERAAAEILGCLEEGLGCSPGALNELVTHENNASELRFNHYPPVPASLLRGGQVSRIWPHFDLGVITLLFTSSVSGLEVEDRSFPAGRQFIPVTPETNGELIVNISETLQRWTDDQICAGLHQVSIPNDIQDKIKDDPETEVPAGTLPFFQVGKCPRYPNITASEYHRLRLLDAY